MSTGRPSQKKQPSRKGKKAWRKNIDLEDVEKNIEDIREAEIVLGSAPLFEVDVQGDAEALTKEMKKEKQLKSLEILNKRSAIPGLKAAHKRKDKPKVKAKKIHDLLRLSGRTGEDPNKVMIEQDGIVRVGVSDPWAEEIPMVPVKRPTTLFKKPEAPVPDTVAVEIPAAGKSYNPDLDDWKSLISAEHKKLEKLEVQRVKAEEEKERIEAILAAAETGDDEEIDQESEEELADPEVRLSVGEAVKNKKKTKQQRARMRRHKEKMQMQDRLKQLRKQLTKIEQAVRDSEKVTEEPMTRKEKKARTLKKAHSRYSVMEPELEVKLSDEMEDSLRRLRPEGNIAKDRFRSLQARGLIEARVPVSKKRRYAKKVTEKWSYKDIKL